MCHWSCQLSWGCAEGVPQAGLRKRSNMHDTRHVFSKYCRLPSSNKMQKITSFSVSFWMTHHSWKWAIHMCITQLKSNEKLDESSSHSLSIQYTVSILGFSITSHQALCAPGVTPIPCFPSSMPPSTCSPCCELPNKWTFSLETN